VTNTATDAWRLLTAEQIEEMTGIKARKVRELIKSGFFPRANIPGRPIRVFQADVERVLMQLKVSSAKSGESVQEQQQAIDCRD